ncbi:MAG: serine/threonine protein kinase [Akkermansiaceae bacterium]
MNSTDDNIAHCEACGCAMDVTMMQPFTNVECPECQTHNRVKVDVGSYILKKRQGVGGMSLVFGAVDKTLGREVAIKILNESYSMDAKRIEQFEQEAKITAAISHPHVVRVYTVGQAFHRFFIAMELVPGDSLEQKMHDSGRLPENDVLKWGRQVCEGLNAANEAGLIHRDIKPGNILFDAEGHVKIVDFGLALVTQGGKAQADEIWATPYYVPPETLDVLEEDFRSDIYALGASLFHALSGKPPFDTETRSTSELKQIKMNLPPLKKSAPWLRDETCAVIDKAMAFSADDRFSSYKEIIDALHRAEMALENEGMEPALQSAQRYQRREKSSAMFYGMIAAGVLGVGVVIAMLSMGGGDDKKDGDASADTIMEGLEGSDDGGAAGRRLAIGIREGREALQARKFNKAANHYGSIARDNRFTINSAMWGGLQSSIVNWLNGKSAEAKFDLRMLNKRYLEAKKHGKGGKPTEITSGLAKAIPLLLKMKPISPSDSENIQSEADAMLVYAGALKNWEEGYLGDAEKMLDRVEEYATKLGAVSSEEFKVYVSLIAGYKNDAVLMQPFADDFIPSSDDEIAARRVLLKAAKGKVKTKGRAVENFAEWLYQLDIHKNRLAYERKMEAADENEEGVNDQPQQVDDWDGFYQSLEKDIQSAKFVMASEKLKIRSFKVGSSNKKKEHMIYLCEKAAGYLGTLSETLSKGVVRADITLKDGKVFTTFTGINTKGITVKDGDALRKVEWGEIETSSVIDLIKISLGEGDLSQFEKNLRIEQAIAFAWLGGEREKASIAADGLAKNNQFFKKRWAECVKLFGE